MLTTDENREKQRQLTAAYQLAHEKFTMCREQVNAATRAMRRAEAEMKEAAHALFNAQQLNLSLSSPA